MQSSLPRILVVEGDAQLRGFLTRVLRECGCTVDAVSNYCEGLRRARGESFSLFITDAFLPDGSGSDLCREIHAINASVPVIICNSPGVHGDVALDAGAHACVRIGDYMTWQLHRLLNQLAEAGMEAQRSGAGPDFNRLQEASPASSPIIV